MNPMSQISLTALTGVAAFVAAIVAPTIWIGDIKQVNAVQDTRISTVEQGNKEIRENVEYIRRAIEVMSVKQGIQGVQGVQGVTGAQGVQGTDAPLP
jgi:hypothetical protein